MTRLYTKTGDKGETSLYTGDRVHKSHPIINAIGSVDELIAHIGNVYKIRKEFDEKNSVNELMTALFTALAGVSAFFMCTIHMMSGCKMNTDLAILQFYSCRDSFVVETAKIILIFAFLTSIIGSMFYSNKIARGKNYDISNHSDPKDLLRIMRTLMEINSQLASPVKENLFREIIDEPLADFIDENKIVHLEGFLRKEIKFLETRIDFFSVMTSDLKKFILPVGNSTAIACNITRTIARRAEIQILEANKHAMMHYAETRMHSDSFMDPQPFASHIDREVFRFMNRLSDYFFALSRYRFNVESRDNETTWTSKVTNSKKEKPDDQ